MSLLTDINRIAGGAVQASSAFSNALDRGYQPDISDPYISGYYYILFTKVPDFIGDNVLNVMRVANNAVTFPDITLNTTEIVTGFGGSGKVTHATSVDKSSDFSIKFNEYTGLPILNTAAQWQQAVRDYNVGLSAIQNYSLSAYTGEVLVALAKPVLNDVKDTQLDGGWLEKAFLFTKVFPTNVPFSLLNQEITSSDKIEVDLQFKHSGFFHGANVNAYALSKFTSLNVQSMLDFAIS